MKKITAEKEIISIIDFKCTNDEVRIMLKELQRKNCELRTKLIYTMYAYIFCFQWLNDGFLVILVIIQSLPITTKIVSSNPGHGEVYLIQHYVIKFIGDFGAGRWFSLGNPVSSTNKADNHDIS